MTKESPPSLEYLKLRVQELEERNRILKSALDDIKSANRELTQALSALNRKALPWTPPPFIREKLLFS